MTTVKCISCLFCLLVSGHEALSQDVAPESHNPSYVLETGKLEIGFMTGILLLEAENYYPGPQWIMGGDVTIGLSPHVALQFGASRTDYTNDLYWRQAIPHNPYRATSDLINIWGDVRYEFRQPSARIRPYIGLGIAATWFANIVRGPKTLCLSDDRCLVFAPEMFEGTKVNVFFDPGLNFMIRSSWGIGAGLKMSFHRGDESSPDEGISDSPTGDDIFSHGQFYARIFRRW